jgi:hypothetical protein
VVTGVGTRSRKVLSFPLSRIVRVQHAEPDDNEPSQRSGESFDRN